jgi:hypothetical protein
MNPPNVNGELWVNGGGLASRTDGLVCRGARQAKLAGLSPLGEDDQIGAT